jgi:phosphodiesterase/alkaline phosphatase D-like protein
MSDLSRRRFLVLSSASTAGVACGGAKPPAADTAPDDDGWLPASTAYSAALDDRYVPSAWFPCGVASGDPTPDAVVLWTRVHPDLGEGVAVRVELTADAAVTTFRQPLSIIEPESEARDLPVVEVQSGSARAVQIAGEPPERAR